MRIREFIFFLLLLFPFALHAQEEVHIGQFSFTPDQNVQSIVSPTRGSGDAVQSLSAAQMGENYYVLLQFQSIPTAQAREDLQSRGIQLLDYLGGNAYYAVVSSSGLPRRLRGTSALSIMPIDPAWKLDEAFVSGDVPEWSRGSRNGAVLANLFYLPVDRSTLELEFNKLGIRSSGFSDILNIVEIEGSLEAIQQLASTPWVISIAPIARPQEFFNKGGAVLSGSNFLRQLPSAGGRNLSGKGVAVGVWDGNVESHVDFGNRIHQQEFEVSVGSSGSHGVHVSGSVGGAGMRDPRAMGMAPKSSLYTYNFNRQSNGLKEWEEMIQAHKDFGITISQNSYGLSLRSLCNFLHILSYNGTGGDLLLDAVAAVYPELTLVYAAGNDGGECDLDYGTIVSRRKNCIYVGATYLDGEITSFSSSGPFDDGRIGVTVSARGAGVLSTVRGNGYEIMDGTSMACPTVSGTLALVTERYHQLHNGDHPSSAFLRGLAANTADEVGEPGPDFRHGYGLINGARAVEVLDNGWYLENEVLKSGAAANVYPLQVPAGTKRARVMLVWNDTITAKRYKLGESPLINDLDLIVEGMGETHYPWVLNGKRPHLPATRGVDRINNIEQVVIENPAAGLYNINVLPTRVASSQQRYSLIWFFEGEDLELFSPCGGEHYAPGEELLVKWAGNGLPVEIEYSHDNGKSYRLLSSQQDGGNVVVTLPEELITKDARIRLRNSLGVVESRPFSVMHRPDTVFLSETTCSSSGWKLKWKPTPEAESYKVLKANVDEGSFAVIESVTSPEFTIPEEHISADMRNLFTVVAVGPGGVESERAVGAVATYLASAPLRENANGDLFDEMFMHYPSNYLIPERGADCHVEIIYRYQDPGVTAPGAHTLILEAGEKAGDEIWPVGKEPLSMDINQNPNAIKLTLCNVDLSDQSGEELILELQKVQRFKAYKEHAVLKLEVKDLSSGVVKDLPDVNGDVVVFGTRTGGNNTYYNLSEYAGKKISISLVFACRSAFSDYLFLDRIRIFKPKAETDVRLDNLIVPQSAPNLAKSPVRMRITNYGNVEAKNVVVGYCLEPRSETYVYETIKSIKPYQTITHSFRELVDFATTEERGERFNVKAQILFDDDVDTTNNYREVEVVNHGDVYTMPFSPLISGFLGSYPDDPIVMHEVRDKIVFTDNGGALNDYSNNQLSTLHFLPATPGRVIMITFKEFKTEGGSDKLTVCPKYTTNLNNTIDYYYYGDVLSGDLECPISFVSHNENGALAVHFRSDGTVTKGGWVAEVSEVAPSNFFRVNRVWSEQNLAEGTVTIKMEVQNMSTVNFQNVRVGYSINDPVHPDYDVPWVEEVISRLPADDPATAEVNEGIVVHTFTRAIASDVKWQSVEAGVRSDDYDLSDNYLWHDFVCDRYCSNRTYGVTGNRIMKVSGDGASWEMDIYERYEPTHRVNYQLGTVFDAYKGLKRVTLFAKTSEIFDANEYYFFAWVDWNDDGKFDPSSERIYLPLEERQENLLQVEFDIPADAKVGDLRLRMAIAPALNDSPCGSVMKKGNMVDFTLRLHEGQHPIAKDLAVGKITAKSGKELSTSEEVKVWVMNKSPFVSEGYTLTLSVNGVALDPETSTRKIHPYDSVEHKFAAKADLSAVGLHTISVQLGDDDVKDNNVGEIEVFNAVPEKDGFYALSFDEKVRPREIINMGNLGQADLTKAVTYEVWANMGKTFLNNIFTGKGVLITQYNLPGATLSPPNSLIVLVGDGLLFHAEGDII